MRGPAWQILGRGFPGCGNSMCTGPGVGGREQEKDQSPRVKEGLFLDQKGLSMLRMTRPYYTADPIITVVLGKPWHLLFPVPLYWVTDEYVRDGTESTRDDAYNLNSGRGGQDNRVRARPNWLKWFFSPIFKKPGQGPGTDPASPPSEETQLRSPPCPTPDL